jgi:hypothetical protein
MELEMNVVPLSKDDYDKLNGCLPEFRPLCEDVNRIMPIRVLWGKRSGSDQHKAFLEGHSKIDYPPGGKHNVLPLSEAIDVTPVPYEEKPKNNDRICIMIGLFLMAALMRGIPLRSGRDWDGDTDLNDQTFNDYYHFEIIT